MPMKDTDPWARMTTEELEQKLAALRKLTAGRMLSERTRSEEIAEIGIIERELAKRHAR